MHKLLLKQQLSRLKDYIALAERKMKKFGPIGPDYKAVQVQIEEQQVSFYFMIITGLPVAN